MASDRDTLIVLSTLVRNAAVSGEAYTPDYGLLRLAEGIERFLDRTDSDTPGILDKLT